MCFCVLSLAHAADIKPNLGRARDHILNGQYEAAEDELKSVLMIDPENREAILLLGISLGRRGELKKASGHLKHALYLDPNDPEANLELGRYFYELGVPQEAADYFERTLELTDGSSSTLSDEASRYLEDISKGLRDGKGKFSLNALAGLQYDTNVPAFSDNFSHWSIGGREDLRAIFNIGAEYQFARTGPFSDVAASYSFYHSAHDDLSAYDTDLHTTALRGAVKYGEAAIELRYMYEHAVMDGYRHSASHSFSPSLVLEAGSDTSAILTYRYKDTEAQDLPASPTNSGRTGHSHLAGISAVRTFGEGHSGRAGYLYETVEAARDMYAYKGHKAFMDVSLRLSKATGASLGAEYYERDYDSITPSRLERRQTASATLKRELGRRISLSLSHAYTWNDSADWRYEYERAVTSLILKARY